MNIVGMVNGSNPDDKRCVKCVDFSNHGRAIYSGEEFDCTYCGKAYLDTSETVGEACEPCARVGYSAKAVNRVEDAHGNMTAMCGDCIHGNTYPDGHTYTNSLGEKWEVSRETMTNGIVLESELANGVKISVSYFGPRSWRYFVKDAYGDGEGASGNEYSPERTLGYVLNDAMNCGTEWAEAAQTDDYGYSDWEDAPDYGYEHGDYDYPDSDLWNEY